MGLVALVFYNLKINKGFNENYISKNQTTAINGIFVILVFMCHFVTYVKAGRYYALYKLVNSTLNSLIVVSFLFYSGYGIMCSIKSKGTSYVRSMPAKRIFKVWYHFALAILLFAVVNIILDRNITVKNILLSFIGAETIGNSSWYIITTIVLYIFTFVAFLIFRKNHILGALTVFALTIGFIIVMRSNGASVPWYKTVTAYPLGMLFALSKDKIEKLMKNNLVLYIGSLVVFGTGLVVFNKLFTSAQYIQYNIQSFFFAGVLILITMKVSVGNKILAFFGKYTFEIYILQRIPMLLLRNVIHGSYYYLVACFVSTLILAVLFRMLTDFLDTKVFKISKKPAMIKA